MSCNRRFIAASTSPGRDVWRDESANACLVRMATIAAGSPCPLASAISTPKWSSSGRENGVGVGGHPFPYGRQRGFPGKGDGPTQEVPFGEDADDPVSLVGNDDGPDPSFVHQVEGGPDGLVGAHTHGVGSHQATNGQL